MRGKWRARDESFLVESEGWEVSRGEQGMGGLSWRARDGRFLVESERWKVSLLTRLCFFRERDETLTR